MRYKSLIAGVFLFTSCSKKQSDNKVQLCDNEDFQTYWCRDKAEISSYDLKQTLYGTVNDGEAVLVFETEDFRKDKQVKLESDAKEQSTKVLKLNFIKRFVTGIHDFSMYTSIFTPIQTNTFSSTLKVSNTNQDWSGQNFFQLNFRQNGYQVLGKSYSEEEVEDDYHIDTSLLEDELWTRIRLVPSSQLPQGKVLIIPCLNSLRQRRKKVAPEVADITLQPYKGDSTFKGKSLIEYKISYPENQRDLRIIFEKDFPHQIVGWDEKYEVKGQVITSRATLKATIQIPYWQKNMPADTIYRKKLDLKY